MICKNVFYEFFLMGLSLNSFMIVYCNGNCLAAELSGIVYKLKNYISKIYISV